MKLIKIALGVLVIGCAASQIHAGRDSISYEWAKEEKAKAVQNQKEAAEAAQNKK